MSFGAVYTEYDATTGPRGCQTRAAKGALMHRLLFATAALCALTFAAVPGHADPNQSAPLPYGNLKWRAVGPSVSGGRVTSVAGSDSDSLLYYAGAAGGGIWRSTDGGSSWTSVDDSLPVNAIGAVAIAASNKKVVWVRTG